MNEEFLTLKYLKEFVDGILVLNKEASRYNDDEILTYSMLKQICPMFKPSSKLKNTIDGLIFDSNNHSDNERVLIKDVQIRYCGFSSLKIVPSKEFISPCGDEIKLSVYGIYRLINKRFDNEEILSEINEEINALIKCNSDWLTINKENDCFISENSSDNDRISVISAKYSFKSKTYATKLELIQKCNTIGDWEFESDKTDYIEATGLNTLISKDGGKCVIIVKRYFTVNYIKKDLCGNIRDNKKESGKCEDITNYCQFSITNTKYFQRMVNTIIAKKQELENEERTCLVTVTYNGEFKDELMIKQEKGSSMGYSYTISFENGEKIKYHYINSCLKTNFIIELISLKNLLIDGEITSSINSYNVSCLSDKMWCSANIIEHNGFPALYVDVINNNINKNDNRECNISIYNNENPTNEITLTVNQSSNKVVSTKYEVSTSGEDTVTYEDVNNYKILFKINKTNYYEDGSTTNELSLSDKSNKIVCEYESTEPTIFNGNKLVQIDFDGTYMMKPTHFGSTSVNNIYLTCKSYVCDKDSNVISDFNYFTLTLLGQDLITYEYNFMFDNNESVYNELFFPFDFLSGKEVKLISTKDKYVNGIKDSTYVVPFDYDFINENDNYKVFRKANSTIEIVPTSINTDKKEHSSILEFKQAESDKVLQMSVIQNIMKDEKYVNIKVTVEAFRTFVEDDIWADYESKLIISDMSGNIVKSILLNKWWLSPEVEFNHDVVFDGTIKLIEKKEYKFEVKNLISKDLVPYEIEKNEITEIHKIKEGEDINIFLEI